LRIKILFFCLFLFFLTWVGGTLTVWENLSVCIFIYFFLDFLETLGKKIVILEFTNIMASMTCLLMPVVFYHEYTMENSLARLWVKYMPVNSDDYFSFMVPAVLALAAGLRVPLTKVKVDKNPRVYMDNVRKILQDKPNLGLTLIAVGVSSGLLNVLLPRSLEQFFYYLNHLTFVGVFYAIYSPSKHKRLIVPGVILLMLGQSLATGMFGDLIFILACSSVLILLGTNISFQKKLLSALTGILLILVMQSVKVEYRKRTWFQVGGADPLYYAQLVTETISNPSGMVEPNKLFYTSVRMNQGWLVAMTMKKVPEKYDFAYGETIWQSVAAAIVPRFLWRDKPEAGGKANLKRFWGYNLVGFSMNIGPFGEAYANFDVLGGIVYMFFYGLLFNYLLSRILKFAEKRPTIVLWLPFLFFYSIGVETDLLSTMGFLLKGLFFMWLIFRAFRITFRMDL
jgi:hypothetical protein